MTPLDLIILDLDATPRHERAHIIRAAIEAGHGNWNVPPDRRPHLPALVEISMHGIDASGLTEAEALANWEKLARAELARLEAEGIAA